MYLRYLLSSVVFALSVFSVEAAGEEADWELKRDRDGIQVYTRPVEGSPYRAVRSTMVVDSSLSAIVGLIHDTDACPKWADLCAESRVIEQVSDTEMYIYTLNDVPWPVSDRDATSHVVWQQDPQSLAVSMAAVLVSDIEPKRKRTVRLAEGTTGWLFTPVGDGKVEIVSSAHLEPGGAIPGWLSNRLLVDSPFTTMDGMRTMLASGAYDDASYGWITEPESAEVSE